MELFLILFGAHLFAVLHEVRNPLIGLFDPCLCLLIDKAFDNGVAEMPLDGLSEIFGSVARLLQKALILGKQPVERDARKAGKFLILPLFLVFEHFLSRRNSVLCTRIEHTQKSSVRTCEHCQLFKGEFLGVIRRVREQLFDVYAVFLQCFHVKAFH